MDSSEATSGEVSSVVHKNIGELYEHRKKHEQNLTLSEKVAIKVAHFTGTTPFLYLNAAFFVAWIALNLGGFGIRPFDPFPFGMLTTVVSLEAIFLSLFVLLSQNRMQKMADQQMELDLQINLLTEYELTRLMQAVDALADKMGVDLPHKSERAELESDIEPKSVLHEIEKHETNS
jgi:uncharacterized membrane protein